VFNDWFAIGRAYAPAIRLSQPLWQVRRRMLQRT
jgi:hypothetical protein